MSAPDENGLEDTAGLGKGATVNDPSMRWHPQLMWLCLFLFVGRVLGQVYVGIYKPRYLPVWEDWYSGLLPYPLLLLCQVLLIQCMTLIAYDVARGTGVFALERPRMISTVRYLGLVYAGGMMVRYVLTMWRQPHRRWLKGTIPIWFHLVLAAFVLLWSGDGALRLQLASQ